MTTDALPFRFVDLSIISLPAIDGIGNGDYLYLFPVTYLIKYDFIKYLFESDYRRRSSVNDIVR
jgi:hypothetical protein